MKKVEGHSGLIRNQSGAIVNNDQAAYLDALKRKNEKKRIAELEKRVEELEKALSSLKEKLGA